MDWTRLKENINDCFTYLTLPNVEGNVMLDGFFQSPMYFPTSLRVSCDSLHVLPPVSLLLNDWSNTFFLHVRRGDYLNVWNRHHNVNLMDYYKRCLSQFYGTCFVVSDDIAWCKKELKNVYPNILWCPESCTDAECLYMMTLCKKGGICANSTYSWWASYILKQAVEDARIYMPATWGHPPMPPVRDLYPVWAIQVPTSSTKN